MNDNLNDLLAEVRQRSDEARLEAAILRENLRMQRRQLQQATEALRKQNASIKSTVAQSRTVIASLKTTYLRMSDPNA